MKFKIRNNFTHVLIIFCLSVVFGIALFIRGKGYFVRLNGDWDATLPTFYFFADYVQKFHTIPQFNPYISTGIPVVADPTSMTFNPVLSTFLVIFGVEYGIKITLVFFYFLAGISMWKLLSKFRVRSSLCLWGALLYMSAGNLAAFWASGSVPKFLVFPVVPLYYFVIFDEELNLKKCLFIAVLLVYAFFSGYIYMLWFLSLIFILVRLYFMLHNIKNFISNVRYFIYTYTAFIIFAAPKLIPLLASVYFRMERYFPIEPYLGSLHFYFFPIGFIMPLELFFYDRPSVQRWFGFHYNWHEYYAFIGAFPLVFLIKIKGILETKTVRLLLLILIAGAFYLALKYPYSPFYWLYHFSSFARSFRIPQRIYDVTTSAAVALCVLCADYWLRKEQKNFKKVMFICIISLIAAISATFYTLYNSFEPRRISEEAIVTAVREKDSGNYYAATTACCLQIFLVQMNMPIINYQGYGWIPKSAPKFITDDGLGYNFARFGEVRARYIFADLQQNYYPYGYYPYLGNDRVQVWKTDTENIIPQS